MVCMTPSEEVDDGGVVRMTPSEEVDGGPSATVITTYTGRLDTK